MALKRNYDGMQVIEAANELNNFHRNRFRQGRLIRMTFFRLIHGQSWDSITALPYKA